jgi:hypothetical protein
MTNDQDNLPPKLKERLKRLHSEISVTQITVSFSLEQRRDGGRKSSAFYSANASRKAEDGSEQWSLGETRIVSCLLSKHVVETVYRDAVHRGVLTASDAREEVPSILARYDRNIENLLGKDDSNGS